MPVHLAEQLGGQVGGQAEHGPDRQVDVAADDDHRLADASSANRGVDQDELDVAAVEERALDHRGHQHEDDEHRDDAGLADPEHPLGQPPARSPGAGPRGRCAVTAALIAAPFRAGRWPRT